MAKETASKPTTSSASSWWSERGKITARKSETEAAKTKKESEDKESHQSRIRTNILL